MIIFADINLISMPMNYWIPLLIIIILLLSIANFIKLDRLKQEIMEIKSALADRLIHAVPERDMNKTTIMPPPVPESNSYPTPPVLPHRQEDQSSGNEAIESVPTDDYEHIGSTSLFNHEPPYFSGIINQPEDNEESEKHLHTEEQHERRSTKFENFIGGNLFSKIGILALVIGIGFFVKYAIDNDWINEVGRTVLGLLIGTAIWGIAFKLRNKYRSFSSVLAGGGFAIYFVTIAIAQQAYQLLSWQMAFGIFILLSALLIFLSLRYVRRELAMIAIIGGYISPFLISNGSHSIVMLFSYIAILTIAMFVITMRQHWWELSVTANILTWMTVAMNVFYDYTTLTNPLIVVSFTSLFFTLFSFPLAIEMESEKRNGLMFFCLIGIALLNPLIYVAISLKVIEATPPLNLFKGFFPLYVASVNLLIFLFFKLKRYQSILSSISLWLIVIFAALFIPVQFGNLSVQSLAFSLYALILTVASISTKKKFLFYASLCVSIITIVIFIRILFEEPSLYPSDTTLLCMGASFTTISVLIDRNWTLFTKEGNIICHNYYGISLYMGCGLIFLSSIGFSDRIFDSVTASAVVELIAMIEIFAISVFGRLSRYTSGFLPLAGIVFFILSSALLSPDTRVGMALHWLAALTYALSLYSFTKRIIHIEGSISKKLYVIYYSLTASVFLITCIMSALDNFGLSRYYSAGFSVSLILSGTLLMLAGMYYRKSSLRVEGLIFFSILLIKLVAYDIWSLPVIGRIIVFILLGAVLLCISFLYQKLKDKLFSNTK